MTWSSGGPDPLKDSLSMTVPPSPSSPPQQGETVVELVDEDHSSEFEELKKVAEEAQGVSVCQQALLSAPPPIPLCPFCVYTYLL